MKNLISFRQNMTLKNTINILKVNYPIKNFSKISENLQVEKNNELPFNKINLEINKNYEDMVKKYRIKNPNKNLEKISQQLTEKNPTIKAIKEKYLNIEENEENKKYFSLIKKFFKEELKQSSSKESKELDDIILFVRNCYTYNLLKYLSDPKYFRNKEIRNKVLNTDLLEKENQAKNPYGYKKELESKIFSGNYYKLLKKEKNEKEDFYTKEKIENDNYKYFNFLAENSEYTKLDKYNENSIHNETLFDNFDKQEELIENPVADLVIDKEISENFYIDFLMKMKEKEKEKSQGFSQMDDLIFAKRLAENKEEILQNKDINESFENITNKILREEGAAMDENSFNAFTDNVKEDNAALHLQNGIDSPWAYYSQTDYPVDEFFSDGYNKGSKNLYIFLLAFCLILVYSKFFSLFKIFIYKTLNLKFSYLYGFKFT
jgi:hypothetical protein